MHVIDLSIRVRNGDGRLGLEVRFETPYRFEDCVVHHTLLGEDIYNIEYVHRLPAITSERLAIVALPVKLAGLDGALARVLAIEGFDLPREFEVTT